MSIFETSFRGIQFTKIHFTLAIMFILGQVNHMNIKFTAITSNTAKSPFLFGVLWFY